jgi:outer membrane protein insertion porin family
VNSGLFESVDLQPQGGTLKIVVKEMPMLNVVDLQGNKRLKDEALKAASSSRSRATSIQPRHRRIRRRRDCRGLPRRGPSGGACRPQDHPPVRQPRRSGVRDHRRQGGRGRTAVLRRQPCLSDRRLRQVLDTKQAGLLRQIIQQDTFVAERLEVDKQLLTDFYLSRGYIDVRGAGCQRRVGRRTRRHLCHLDRARRSALSHRRRSRRCRTIEGPRTAEFEAVQKIRAGQTYSPR